jgi:hypothetical protein
MHSDDSIPSLTVLPGLVPGIHVLRALKERRGWPGTSPAKTIKVNLPFEQWHRPRVSGCCRWCSALRYSCCSRAWEFRRSAQ